MTKDQSDLLKTGNRVKVCQGVRRQSEIKHVMSSLRQGAHDNDNIFIKSS